MKGLRLYLTPFAPDTSGASSILYTLKGLTVILDAGGCTGNVCGFDEPRWQNEPSLIFSAGMRDMDAILGNDALIIQKIVEAANTLKPQFISLLSTPVPEVIGLDIKGLAYLIEAETHLPVISIQTNGIDYYDKGIEKAYLALFKKFPKDTINQIGLLGYSPLTFNQPFNQKYCCYQSLDNYIHLPNKNYVVSVSGLKAAKYLLAHHQIPYEIGIPDFSFPLEKKKTLIIHDQIIGNSIRKQNQDASITVASFFKMDKELMKKQDKQLKEEEDLLKIINDYEVVVGDKRYQEMIKNPTIQFIELKHEGVSGNENKMD